MKRASCFLTGLLILWASATYAQVGDGGISGFVHDEQKAFITAVKVIVTGEAIMGARTTNSGIKGGYRIINLPPGVYTLTFSKDGYKTQEIKGISVRAGKTSSFNITLSVGDFEETISIVQEAPIIDLTSAEKSLNIDGEFLRRLPLSPNQDWRTAWSMVPGMVSDADFNFNEVALEGLRLHGDKVDDKAAIYFTGQNVFGIDGMSAMSALSTSTSNQIAMDIIEDIEIVTSGFDASKPASLGGYMNVVTRSGGNEFHGSFTLVVQPEDWNWSNIEDGTPKSLEQYQPSVTLGGPIFKDRTWFFANYRYDFRNEGVSRSADTRGMWEAFGLEMPTENNENRNHTAFVKLTQQVADSHKATYTFIGSRRNSLFMSPTQSFSTASHGLSESNTHHVGVSSVWNDIFNTTFSMSWNDGWHGTPDEYRDLGNDPSITHYHATWRRNSYSRITGTQVQTGGLGTWTERNDDRLQVKADGTYYLEDFKGTHELSFGLDYTPITHNDRTVHYSIPFGIDRYYPDGTGPATSGLGIGYTRTERSVDVDSFRYTSKDIDSFAIYGQDTWNVNERLTISLGLRVERQWDPIGDFTDIQASPNIGFVYALTGDSRNILRVSYGRKTYALHPSQFQIQEGENFGEPPEHYSYDYDLDGTWDFISRFDPEDPQNLVPGQYDTGNGIRFYDPDLIHPRADQFQIGFTRVMPHNIKVDATYHYKIYSNNARQYVDTYKWENGEFRGYTNESPPYFQWLYTNNKWSTVHYQGLELLATKQMSSGWQMIASYSWNRGVEKGTWSPFEWEAHHMPESWYEDPYKATPHQARLASSFVMPFDIVANTNIVWRTGNWLPATTFMNFTDFDFPRFYTMPDGKKVQHPAYGLGRAGFGVLAGPRSDDRPRGESLTNVNLGFGKNFTVRNYTIETQVQFFNIFNFGADLRDKSGSTVLNPDGTPYHRFAPKVEIQSPRAAQLKIKLVF